MQLFPERFERRDRRLLWLALALSILLHAAVALIVARFSATTATALARLMPRATPQPDVVALSDAITIEKRTVPPQTHRAPPPRAARPRSRAEPRPPQLPVRVSLKVPTLRPLATSPPLRRPERVASEPPSARKSAFTPQQIAALDAQFSRTISSAQRALTNVPPQRERPANAQRPHEAVMAGTQEQFLSAQGDCTPLQGPMIAGPQRSYYIQCVITYSDGYFEQVSFPWPYRFTRRSDPFQYYDNRRHGFPMEAPPDGFTLPQAFALSRAVCVFYRDRCNAVIRREQAEGDPAYGKPP